MLLLQLYLPLFLILWPIDYSNGQLHLYYSSDGSEKLDYDYDCLDFYANDQISHHNSELPYRQNHQIIPFCRRNNIDDGLMVPGIDIPTLTFKELNECNVSSLDLYAWSAPIDLIEHYQAYREHKIDDKSNASLSKSYNCSLVLRFGSLCQYYFDLPVSRLYGIWTTGISKSGFRQCPNSTGISKFVKIPVEYGQYCRFSIIVEILWELRQ